MTNEVTAAELLQLRSDIELWLPDTCSILEPTRTSDGQGGYTEAWGTVAGTVICRLDNSSGAIRSTADRSGTFSSWVLTVPQDTEIETDMHVIHESEEYNVMAVSDTGSWLGCKRAQLERL